MRIMIKTDLWTGSAVLPSLPKIQITFVYTVRGLRGDIRIKGIHPSRIGQTSFFCNGNEKLASYTFHSYHNLENLRPYL